MSTETYIPNVYDVAAMVPDDKRGVAEALAQELAFMGKTLEKLREHIGEHGPVEWYENGKQACWRESPAMKSYTAMIARYSALYKQLVGLLPAEVADQGDELEKWLEEN